MLLKLEMPFVNPIITEGVVEKWHIALGDTVSYGDPVCDVRIERTIGIKRKIMAYQLLGGGRKKQQKEERGEKPVNALVHVKASDGGMLRDIVAGPGDVVQVGEVMAVFSTDANDAINDESIAEAAGFRAVGNLVESNGEME